MPSALRSSSNAPRQLFGTTRAQRVALARQQFFEEGVRPSGLVGEAVIQSWMRCQRAHADTKRIVAFDPVSPSRLHATLGRHRDLLSAAQPDLAAMEGALGGTDCRVILTDGEGVVLHVTPHAMAANQPVLRQTARLGVNIAEHMVGTTAPGIVASTGLACTVNGAEHYFEQLREMQCAAAPIRDVNGRLAAVLDLTAEGRHFDFDAISMVGLYATTIENRLLEAQSGELLVLRFQASPALIGTPLEGLAGITASGTVAWLNEAGMRLIGPLPAAEKDRGVAAMLGHELPTLVRLRRCDTPQPLRLASGLGVWMHVRLRARDGLDFRHAVALPPHDGAHLAQAPASRAASPVVATRAVGLAPAQSPQDDAGDAPEKNSGSGADMGAVSTAQTLRAQSLQLVKQALAAHGGNVSSAARQLGISRGALYRRLREADAGGHA